MQRLTYDTVARLLMAVGTGVGSSAREERVWQEVKEGPKNSEDFTCFGNPLFGGHQYRLPVDTTCQLSAINKTPPHLNTTLLKKTTKMERPLKSQNVANKLTN